MFTALSYIMAHWFLILSVIGGTAALVAFAWFTKNWKAALAAVVLVFAALAYQSADLGGYKRALDEAKAREIAILQGRIDTLSLVGDLDAKRAAADAQLNHKDESLTLETPPNAGACLPRAAVSRLRAIGANGPVAAPAPARRYPKLLPKRSGPAG